MQILKIALLNLIRERKRTLMLGGAIAFGLFILTFILSLSNGLKRTVQENVGNILSGHIFIHRVERFADGSTHNFIPEDDDLLNLLEESGVEVESIHRRSYTDARFIFNGETQYSTLEGIQLEEELSSLSQQLPVIQGDINHLTDKNGIAISANLRDQLGVEVGDVIIIQFQTVQGQQNVGDFMVKAIYELPGIEGEWASNYTNIENLNSLLNIPQGGYMTLAVKLKDLDHLNDSTANLMATFQEHHDLIENDSFNVSLSDSIQFAYRDEEDSHWEGIRFEILNLNNLIGFVDELIQMINIISYGLLVLLLCLIILGIQNTYRLILKERVVEIGTFRALGMYRKDVRSLFFMEPLMLSLLGAFVGVIAAIIVGKLFSLIPFSTQNLFSLFLMQGHARFVPPIQWLSGALFLVISITTLSIIRLASKAAKLSPTEAFRHL